MNPHMTIRELSDATGVSAHTLRYYEQAGLMPPVARDPGNGHRRYEERHVRWVAFLRRLRSAGMPIAQVRSYVEMVRRGPIGNAGRMEILAEHRERVMKRIEELRGHLVLLDAKLARGCGPEEAPSRTARGMPE